MLNLEDNTEFILYHYSNNSGQKLSPNVYLELDADLELTPPRDLRWDIDRIEPRDRVDPKLR